MLKTTSITGQVAAHLREKIRQGHWTELMPGRDKLIAELGVGGRTIERALVQLEQEGLLKPQGAGKRRRIVAGRGNKAKTAEALRVGIILYEREDALSRHIYELRRQLQSAGHEPIFAPKTLGELKHDPKRVTEMMGAYPVGAWVVQAGSRTVLERVSQLPVPVFALFGLMTGLPIAGTGPDLLPALREAIDFLHKDGHRRIVLLEREERRNSGFGAVERVFFDELRKRNLSASSSYNLPDWEESSGGLRRCLDSLFAVTPPSAFVISDWMLFLAVENYLARGRQGDPGEVALVCTEYHPSFKWCSPAISHFRWDFQPMARRIIRWTDNVIRGKEDRTQRLIPASFVGGGFED